jgi:hypothetical protein
MSISRSPGARSRRQEEREHGGVFRIHQSGDGALRVAAGQHADFVVLEDDGVGVGEQLERRDGRSPSRR